RRLSSRPAPRRGRWARLRYERNRAPCREPCVALRSVRGHAWCVLCYGSDASEESCDTLWRDFGQRGRIPAWVLVLVDDQRPHAFHDVALVEPLPVQVQVHAKAIGQGQLAAATEHFQGSADRQWRAAVDDFQSVNRPVAVFGPRFAGQGLADRRDVVVGEVLLDGGRQRCKRGCRQLVGGQRGEQGVEGFGGRNAPVLLVEALLEFGEALMRYTMIGKHGM